MDTHGLNVKILLDIDGVLVTTPPWRPAEIQEDGFMIFNMRAAANLSTLITETKASIVLTTSHRISYSNDEWKDIFLRRGITVSAIAKVNGCSSLQDMGNRGFEIEQWVAQQGSQEVFVIIDDDRQLETYPWRSRRNG